MIAADLPSTMGCGSNIKVLGSRTPGVDLSRLLAANGEARLGYSNNRKNVEESFTSKVLICFYVSQIKDCLKIIYLKYFSEFPFVIRAFVRY